MQMLDLVVQVTGDGAWPDLAGKEVIGYDEIMQPLQIAGLAGGLASGKPSVTLRVDLPDGRVVLAQTSLALLLTAADALRARYGDPRQELRGEGGRLA